LTELSTSKNKTGLTARNIKSDRAESTKAPIENTRVTARSIPKRIPSRQSMEPGNVAERTFW
jgi:hypothetical protein